LSQDLEEKQRLRLDFLKVIYNLSGGDTTKWINGAEVKQRLGITNDVALKEPANYLDAQGLIKIERRISGGLPALMRITHIGVVKIEDALSEQKTPTRSPVVPAVTDPAPHIVRPTIQLFISHASDDIELARNVVILVSTALNLAASTIRCTSVDGYRLPAGANTNEQLRQEVHDSVAFIGIVSQASIRSTYVLFELGARWGAGKNLIPLLAHGVSTTSLGGPLSGLNALRADSSAQVHQLVDDLARQLSVRPQSAAVFDRALQAVVGNSAASSSTAPIPQADRHSVAAVDGSPVKLEVRKNHTAVDDLSGASVSLLNVLADHTVNMMFNPPAGETQSITKATAGYVLRFASRGTMYRMLLTSVDYGKDLVTIEIRKDFPSA